MAVTVTVEVPDRRAANVLAQVAAMLGAGNDVIVLRRPPGIPDSAMPGLMATLTPYVMAAAINGTAHVGVG